MPRTLFLAWLLAGGLLATGPAAAWLAYPADDRAATLIVELDRGVAETVPFKALPPPFDAALRQSDVARRLSFRWRYDSRAQGRAVLVAQAAGQGTLTVEFAASEPPQGLRFGVAVVLLGQGGAPLHSFYARADSLRPSPGDGAFRHRVALSLRRDPAWWRGVSAVTVLRMTYHREQRIDDRETWRAMRRAVWRLTKGQGTEQRGS